MPKENDTNDGRKPSSNGYVPGMDGAIGDEVPTPPELSLKKLEFELKPRVSPLRLPPSGKLDTHRSRIKPGFKDTDGYFVCDVETTGLSSKRDCVIEVAGVFVSPDWMMRGTYSSLVLSNGLRPLLSNGAWPAQYNDAYNVHKIEVRELLKHGKSPNVVAAEIDHLVYDLKERFNLKRVILVSDNARFEWGFIQALFKPSECSWPFHYAAWDTNLLLEATGIGDPRPEHRAHPDAIRLYLQLVKAFFTIGVI